MERHDCVMMATFLYSERVIVVSRQISSFSAIPWREQVTFDEMMMTSTLYWTTSQDVHLVLDHQPRRPPCTGPSA